MFTKVSVLIPTRLRIARLETVLASFRYTTKPGEAELVFRVDEDDPETQNFLGSCDPHLMIVGPRKRGYASMPDFFNEAAAAARGDVLMCGNDDMVFLTKGWAEEILKTANQFPDGLFNIGVKTLNETHYPFSCVSKRVAQRLGFLWDPTIFWGDIYLRDVIGAFDRLVMLEHVQIDHDWAGFKPDKVFAESDKDITGKDPTYWSGTHRAAVDNAISRLRGLLAHDKAS